MVAESQRLVIVTGTSAGIGNAVALQLLEREWAVIGISRRAADFRSDRYTHLQLDLSEVSSASRVIEARVSTALYNDGWSRVGLVNNARRRTCSESASPQAPHRANIAIRSCEPGVVDTDMQRLARSLSPEVLPWGSMYHDFVRRGVVVDTSKPAAEIVEFLESDGDVGFTEARLR